MECTRFEDDPLAGYVSVHIVREYNHVVDAAPQRAGRSFITSTCVLRITVDTRYLIDQFDRNI